MSSAVSIPMAAQHSEDDDTAYFDHLQAAVACLHMGNPEGGLDACSKAAAIRPDGAEALCILGLVVFQMGDVGRAIELVERAHHQDPDCRNHADALAVMNAKIGKLAESIYYAKLAVALTPRPELSAIIPEDFRNYREALDTAAPSPFYVNAFAQCEARNYEKAVELCHRELRINERHAACYRLLGSALAALGRYDQAVEALHAAIHIEPDDARASLQLGDSLLHLGRFEEARACLRRAVDLAPGDLDVGARAGHTAAHLGDGDGPSAIARGRAMGSAGLGEVEPVDRSQAAAGVEKSRLRIGYVSNAFYGSPENHFIEAVFKSHDRARVEIYGYQQNSYADLSTTRFKSYAAQWREIYDVDDDTAAWIIASDGIDMLVDLCRYEEGQRLGLFARRPAPLQVAWLAWPNGAGTGVFDAVLGDPVTASADRAAATDETCLEISHGLVAFDAASVTLDASRVADSPVAENGFVTFGGIADMARLTPAVAAAWSRVLGAVPGSRLLLGNVDAICRAAKDRAQEMFSHFGMLERLLFQKTAPGEVVNLAFLSQVDVLLDTFPVSGSTEICEALLAGVPVVTLAGGQRSSLSGASILHAAGHGEWVAGDEDAFVAAATSVSADTSRLATLRTAMRDAVGRSALCDGVAFTRALEDACRGTLEATTSAKRTAGKTGRKKTPATRTASKKTASKKSAAKKSTAKRSTAKKSTAKKSAAKKSAAKKSAAATKKAAAKKRA